MTTEALQPDFTDRLRDCLNMKGKYPEQEAVVSEWLRGCVRLALERAVKEEGLTFSFKPAQEDEFESFAKACQTIVGMK